VVGKRYDMHMQEATQLCLMQGPITSLYMWTEGSRSAGDTLGGVIVVAAGRDSN
jgi:hypothetical protein